MVTGVAVGILALGERLPGSPTARLARLTSWLLILAGIAGLAGGSGETHAVACRSAYSGAGEASPASALNHHECDAESMSRCGGAGGLQQMLGLGASRMPAWMWGYIPSRVAAALRTAARSYVESRLLPVIAVGSIASTGSPLLSRPRGSHRKVGSLGQSGLGAGQNSSTELLDSPKFRTYGSSPRRGPSQLQTPGLASMTSLSRQTPELRGAVQQPSIAAVPSTPHAQ
jgi:hypothetical protein